MTARDAAQRAVRWLTTAFIGRLLLVALAIKAVVWTLRAAGITSALVSTVNAASSALLLIALVVIGYRLYVHAKRVVLWRVRRKLMLSYVFIGLVPVLLLLVFFSIAGLLVFFNFGGYLLRARVGTLVERAQALAQTAAADLAHVRGVSDTAAALAAHQQRANAQFPLVSYAVVPASAACSPGTALGARGPVAVAGPWQHVPPPAATPEWVSCAGYSSLVAGHVGDSTEPWVAARALAWVTHDTGREAVIVDVPLSGMLLKQIAGETGVAVTSLLLFDDLDGPFEPKGNPDSDPNLAGQKADLVLGPANITLGKGGLFSGAVSWASFVDYTSWDTGMPERIFVRFDLGLRSV